MAEGFDVLIIGAGPAGLAAGMYAARANMKTLVLGFPSKSNMAKAKRVFNYLGFPEGIGGEEFQQASRRQAERYKAAVLEKEVVSVDRQEKGFRVKTSDENEYEAKAIVIACGKSYKRIGLQNEETFVGKGVHYCVICDGYFYKSKKVAVIGNGNYAAEEALELLSYTKNITIFSNDETVEISENLLKKLKENNIGFTEGKISAFEGDRFFRNLLMADGSKAQLDGVFIAVGVASASAFSNRLGIGMDTAGNVVVDRDGKTNVDGIFAAGDCTGGNPQALKSAGEGCNAALAAVKFVKGRSVYIDYKEE
ncbi:MAG: FAD-dependent oxidoreductase [Candidatus Aenigmarchaeota archaeon]|nr:FAD-dependent oxidoreductase [Candidatus Aenigmarchaeota archaeon]